MYGGALKCLQLRAKCNGVLVGMRTIAGQAQMKPKPTILKVRIEKGRCVCVLRLDKRAGSSVVAERLAKLLHTQPAVIRSLPTECLEERRWQTTNKQRAGGQGFT